MPMPVRPMSTPVPPENVPAPPPSSAPAGSSTPNASAPAPSSTPAEYTFGADAPAWARGRSASEILGLVEKQNAALQQYVQQPPAPQPQPTYQAPQAYAPPAPDDYVTGQTLEQYGERFSQRFQPDLQHVVNMQADMALDLVKRENAEHFARYGPEIYANLASLSDKRAWTVDNLRKVVKITLVDHLDDLARERAARIASEMEPTLRSTGAGGSPITHQQADHTLQSEKLPSDWRERAAKVGLTEQALNEFCQVNGMSREQFLDQFGKTAISEIARG